MSLDLVVFKIAVIVSPGIIWALIDEKFCTQQRKEVFRLSLCIFIYGMVSYIVVYLMYLLFGYEFDLDVDKISDFGVNGIYVDELIFALLTGFILSLIWCFAKNNKILTRVVHSFNITKKYGDVDVWDYTFNSASPAVEYVHFRDFENEIVYCGWVSAFSENEKLRELLLRDVEIYNFSSELLFESPSIYLSRARETMHIEFPAAGEKHGR